MERSRQVRSRIGSTGFRDHPRQTRFPAVGSDRTEQAAARTLRHRAPSSAGVLETPCPSGSHADSRSLHTPFSEGVRVSFSQRCSPSACAAPSAQRRKCSRGLLRCRACTPASRARRCGSSSGCSRASAIREARRPVRAAHGDDGAHAARRRRPRPLGARHEAVPEGAQARTARRPRRPALARHPPPARRRAGQGRAAAAERAHAARLSRRDRRRSSARRRARACASSSAPPGCASTACSRRARCGRSSARSARARMAGAVSLRTTQTATHGSDAAPRRRRRSPTSRPARSPRRRPAPAQSAPTASPSRRPARRPRSPRSSRPATSSRTCRTASAAGTRAGRTRATTARAR